ncbi:MAG: hydrogenase nickel incorporation protein HypB [Burkholderiales bacterium]|nr:hydrogenase nickel incorporation protein HypB [Burkholderiales bacterium]
MCTTCGCSHGETRIDGVPTPRTGSRSAFHHADPRALPLHRHADGSWHGSLRPTARPARHAAPLGAVHDAALAADRVVAIEQDILARNDAFAQRNRQTMHDRGIFALNLVSSPGSGKTTLLVRTIEALKASLAMAVVEGDQQTSLDADRIRATGAAAVQINTGRGCHLDAQMVGDALTTLDPAEDSLLLIENVGNLVCPAAFDLGETHKVVILSVTEGDDKPQKYPDMFRAADLMLINKVDLLPYVAFDVDAASARARAIRPGLPVMCVSATSGEGLAAWLSWIEHGCAAARNARDRNAEGLRRRVAELEAKLAAAARGS